MSKVYRVPGLPTLPLQSSFLKGPESLLDAGVALVYSMEMNMLLTLHWLLEISKCLVKFQRSAMHRTWEVVASRYQAILFSLSSPNLPSLLFLYSTPTLGSWLILESNLFAIPRTREEMFLSSFLNV